MMHAHHIEIRRLLARNALDFQLAHIVRSTNNPRPAHLNARRHRGALPLGRSNVAAVLFLKNVVFGKRGRVERPMKSNVQIVHTIFIFYWKLDCNTICQSASLDAGKLPETVQVSSYLLGALRDKRAALDNALEECHLQQSHCLGKSLCCRGQFHPFVRKSVEIIEDPG
jgi:hypothetical protein